LLVDLAQKTEHADQIGFSNTIAADKNIEPPQLKRLLADRLEAFDREFFECAHPG